MVVIFALGLVLAGIWSFRQIKVEAYPDLSETQVTVISLVPGMAAEEIEQQVTIPVERSLQSLPNAISRRSRTIFGLSVVNVTFEYGADEAMARQAVLEKLRDVELPDGIAPSLAPPTTPAGELYRYVVEADRLDEVARREIQDWVIAPRLMQIPGVGDVFAFGGLVKQFQIKADPAALYRHGLDITQIAEAVEANNRNAGGAMVTLGRQAMVVRGVGLLRNREDLERVVVTATEGVPVLVRDIGRVEVGSAQRTGIFGWNDRSGLVEGVVAMRRGDNPSEVLAGIQEAVKELNETLPAGVKIRTIYDRTELVESTLTTVSRTLLEGLVAVMLIILVFFGSIRAAVLAALTIPLALLFAFVCMQLADIPANLLSLGALDLGIIVEGSLIMVAQVMRNLHQLRANGQTVSSPLETIRAAVQGMEKPIFVSLSIIITAYFPLFGLERVERRIFTPMAYTVCFALIGAMILALTLVPALAALLYRKRTKTTFRSLSQWEGFSAAYAKLVRWCVLHGWAVAAAVAVLLVGAGAAAVRLGTEFLPQLDEGVIWVRATLPPGVDIGESSRVASRIRDMIRQSPEVDFVTSQTGRQDSNTEPFGPNRTEFLVALKPYHSWIGKKSKAALVDEISRRLQRNVPGVAYNFTQPILDMVTEAVTGSSADLAVVFTGPDLAELRSLAEKALVVIRAVQGSADSSIEQDADQSQLSISLDRAAVARYGLTVAKVQEYIELAIGGRSVSTLYENDRRFDIAVRYMEEARDNPEAIRQLLVTTPDGSRIPLSQLADIRIDDGASIISRKENQREISVRTNIRNRDQGSFVAEVQQRLAAEVPMKKGYRVEWGGQFENLSRASERLKIIIPATILLMFGLLYLAFGSSIDAFLVLLNVPLAMIGGVLGLLWRGIPFSISAAVGFVSVFGVSIMMGVLFLAKVNRQRSDPSLEWAEAIVRAAQARFVQNLLIVLVALFGMVPAAMASGVGSDIQRPMATVIVGGLASTLLITVVAMPGLYALFSRRRPPSKPLLPGH